MIIRGDTTMPTEGKGRLFRRKDGKYLIYIPKDVAEDSMFPFKEFKPSKRSGRQDSIPVKVSFKIGEKTLTIEQLEQ
jgi:flagellar motor switch/type III secretory pathway protein FliN